MWYFLSWLSSIQLRAGKPWKTDKASRNIGRTLLKATMASDGRVVWTKLLKRGLRAEASTTASWRKLPAEAPLSQEVG